MGRSWRASSDLTAQKIRLFYSQKMLTKYEAFFTEIYENDRFSQGVGWKCKVFFANPVLGGRTKSAVRAHNHSYDWIIYCKRRFCAGSRFRRWNRTFREPIRPIQNIKYEIHNFLDFSFFRFCRSSGLKGKKSGPFTLLVLMIGAVFRMLPQNSRKIERAKKIVFRRANWGIGIIRTHAWMRKTVGLEICFFWHVR